MKLGNPSIALQTSPYQKQLKPNLLFKKPINIPTTLELLWPLLQTKNIIRILAKLLTTSDAIHDIFPHGFFPDD